VIGGIVTGLGWFFFLDGVISASHDYDYTVSGAWWIPGIMQSIALLMVNILDWNLISDDMSFDGTSTASKAKCWIFVSFVVAFAAIMGAVWILVEEIHTPSAVIDTVTPPVYPFRYPAVTVLLQSMFIFIASLLFRIVRVSDDHTI